MKQNKKKQNERKRNKLKKNERQRKHDAQETQNNSKGFATACAHLQRPTFARQ